MADLSKITLPNGSTYDLKDTVAYRSGDVIRNVQSSTNIAPMYVKTFFNKKKTDYFQSIRAFAGEGDWLYCADKDSHFTITCSKAIGGSYGNYKSLFNHNMSDTLLVKTTDLPFTLEILKDSNITATDVIYLMTCSHTLGSGQGKLTDYKIEVYVTTVHGASTLVANSWNTVVERSGVSDEVQGMIHSLNVGTGGYVYIKGIRLTITGITPASTNPSAWNYDGLPITSLQLVDGRPSFTAAQGLGALDVIGGTVYGSTTFKNGINGDLTGKVNGHTINSDVPSGAKFTDYNKFFIGTCATAAGTKDKVVTLNDATGFSLSTGVVVAVKFTYSNSYSNTTSNPITLNVNSSGAKNIWYGPTHSGAGNTGTIARAYGYANRYIYYMYDGTYWVWLNHDVDDDANNVLPYCTTAAGTAAKYVVCTYYELAEDSYIPIVIQYTNTAASALTLNINGKGAKPLYINGSPSSSSNHTLPRGTYIVFYDGTNYYLRTDGKLTANITGNARTVNGHTVASDVPSNLNTVITNLSGTVGSPNNAIYLNAGTPTPVDHSIGHDEDENVVVAWDGGEVITPSSGTALAISQGGTGATTAAEARTNLGLGSAATYNVVSSVNDDSNLVTGAAIKAYYEAVGIPSAISTTGGGTAAKVATCSSFKLLANSYIQVILANANTANSILTLNINSTGAKTIFINGTTSSSSNKTLPAGSYFVFYNGTNYYFRTDGKLTGDITGNAETATNASKVNNHTVAKDVPSNAVFTDTTALGSMTGTLGIAHGGTGATTVAGVLTALGLSTDADWLTLSSTYTSASIYYRKCFGIVFVTFASSFTNLTTHDYTTIATLPSGYRPSTTIQFVCHSMGGTVEYFGRVLTSGAISVYNPVTTAGTSYVGFTAVFPV